MRSVFAMTALALALGAPAYAQTAPAPMQAKPAVVTPPANPAAPPASAPSASGAAATAAQATEQAAKDAAQATGQAVKDAAQATGRAMKDAGAAMSATAAELSEGWTLKRSVIGQSVYDDKNVRVGEIDDIVLTGDQAKGYKAYAVVGVGGFLGIGERNVATPLSNLKRVNGKFVMPGATKAELKTWPAYTYPDQS